VLREIGAAERPQIEVLNKSDRVTEPRREVLRALHPSGVALSARTGEGLDALLSALGRELNLVPRSVRLRFKTGEGRAIAALYGSARVVSHEVDGDDVLIEAEMPGRSLGRYQEWLQ